MAKKRSKKRKFNRRRTQIRIFKLIMMLLAIALPCILLIGDGKSESEPMRVARTFAHHLINEEYNEACSMATPQSLDDIMFYATWRGNNSNDSIADKMRFKITHAQLLMPSDSTNMIYGKVMIKNSDGDEELLHRLQLKMVYTLDGWIADYEAPLSMWK